MNQPTVNLRVICFSFLVAVFFSLQIKAEALSINSELDPVISAKLLNQSQAIYDRAAEQSTTQRWLIGQRMELLADPLNLKIHKILRKSPLSEKYLPIAMNQVREIIWESNIGHQDSGTLAIPGEKGQLQDLLKQTQDVASVFPFTKKARENAMIFSLPGEVNAYTWSGDVAYLDAAFFDALIKKINDKGSMNQIIGHELAHILFGHIPDRILLHLIFYGTAKNLIPKEEDGNKSQGDRNEKDKKSLRFARNEFLDNAVEVLVREVIPHAGKQVDKNPAFRNQIRKMIETVGDQIAQNESRENLIAFSSDIIRAIRGLSDDAEVDISKEAEKQFKEDLDRFSRSCETSCDRAGYLANKILNEKDHHRSSVMAYVRLIGSENATYEGTMEQVRRLYEQTLEPESRARFRNVGKSHPNTYARAKQFDIFRESEAFRILSDPFLTALTDYIALSGVIVDLRSNTLSPDAQELYDRVSSEVNREALVHFVTNLSSWIQDVVVDELEKVQSGKSKDVSATIILLETLKRIVGDGAAQGSIPSLRDLRDELGRPKRLFGDLIVRLKKLDAEVNKVKGPIAQPTTPAPSIQPHSDSVKAIEEFVDADSSKTIYALVIQALEDRMPGGEFPRDVQTIISKAKNCRDTFKLVALAAKK